MGREGGHEGCPLPGLFLNGVVELVADFAEQVLGDADRLQRLGASGVALVGDGKQTLKLTHEGLPCLVEFGLRAERG